MSVHAWKHVHVPFDCQNDGIFERPTILRGPRRNRYQFPGASFRLGAFALTCVLMLSACTDRDASEPELNATETIDGTSVAHMTVELPAFSAQGVRGETIDERLLAGKVALVNFWATWCGPCIIETPELVGLYEEWSHRPFQILGVSMDTYADEEVADFVDNFAVTYPVFVDTMGVADAFGGAFALPTTYLVDGSGTIIRRYIGLLPVNRIRGELDSLVTALE